jgi:Domain of unknown function (DUF4326)
MKRQKVTTELELRPSTSSRSGMTDRSSSASHSGQRACMKVPSSASLEREMYESFPETERRCSWARYVLGENGVYVGRPKNDGGWYQVETVKRGSMFANPFQVQTYGLERALELYELYSRARLESSCELKDIIELLPEKEQNAATQFYITKVGNGKGKSTKHYELEVMGEAYKNRLLELKGRRLGCFCDLSHMCHADVLLKLIEELELDN